jgi:hypothetical protein
LFIIYCKEEEKRNKQERNRKTAGKPKEMSNVFLSKAIRKNP